METPTSPVVSSQEKLAAALASFLFFVPLLMNVKTPFVVKYMKQGFVVNVVELILLIAANLLGGMFGIVWLTWMAFVITSVFLAVQAFNGKEFAIPFLLENAEKLIQTLGISNMFTPGK